MSLDGAHLVQTKAPGLGLENTRQTTLQLRWTLASLASTVCLSQSRYTTLASSFLAVDRADPWWTESKIAW